MLIQNGFEESDVQCFFDSVGLRKIAYLHRCRKLYKHIQTLLYLGRKASGSTGGAASSAHVYPPDLHRLRKYLRFTRLQHRVTKRFLWACGFPLARLGQKLAKNFAKHFHMLKTESQTRKLRRNSLQYVLSIEGC